MVFLIKIMTDHKVKSEFIIYLGNKNKDMQTRPLGAVYPIYVFTGALWSSGASRGPHYTVQLSHDPSTVCVMLFALAPNSFIQMGKK